MKRAYVVFDRDGTLIEHVHHLVDPGQVKLFNDVIPGLQEVASKGYRLGIVSNQSVIERGLASIERVNFINSVITNLLCTYHIEFDFILICPHKPESLCECRKPKTLLGERAISEFSLDPGKSFMVGDQVSDIEFGRKLGMKTIGIRNELLVGQRLDYYCKDIIELSKLLP